MRGRRSPFEIVLTDIERAKLRQIVRATTAPAGKVERAWIVLKFAEGRSISEIARQLELPRVTVRKWVKRFVRFRLKGLHDLPRTGRPPAFSPGGRVARRQACVRTA
jgi:transposase